MPITHNYTLICETAIRSQPPEMWTYVNVFRNIRGPQMPIAIRCYFVVDFLGNEADQYTLVIEGPEGFNDLLLVEGQVPTPPALNHPNEIPSLTLVYENHPAVFSVEGEYSLVLRSRGEIVHSYSFGVFIANIPNAPMEGGQT